MLKIFKSLISNLLLSKWSSGDFRGSSVYWEDRYKSGETSGSGSYGRLGEFKAEFLNAFLAENNINQVIEWGFGDGHQLNLIGYKSYKGYEVSKTALKICTERFRGRSNLEFFMVSDYGGEVADLSISLDVIYHLIEDEAYHEYMKRLFLSSRHYVIIYSYSFEKTYEWSHERGRNFLKWIDRNCRDWSLISVTKNPYPYEIWNPNDTSQSSFFVFKKN